MRWIRPGAASLAAAAIAALVYKATLAPTVGAGDSGELILAAESLGIPHPPGYPIWVLLARVAALLPIGAVAWRVNLLSALLSAAAVGLFFLLATRVGLRRPQAALATACFGASTIVWRSAVEAEVYPLATLFFLALCLLALRARSGEAPSRKSEALYFFAAGLSVLVHQTLVFPAAVLGAWVWARDPRPARVASAAGWAALGVSTLFLIPIRSMAGPAFSWTPEQGLGATLGNLVRGGYGPIQQNPFRFDLFTSDIAGMGILVGQALGLPAAILAATGLLCLRNDGRSVRPILAAALAIPVALAALLVFTPDAEHLAQVAPILTPVAAALGLAAGFGADAIIRRIGAGWRVPVAAAIAACALVTSVQHFQICDRSAFRLAERYGRDLLRDLPPGATLVLDGDNETFLAAYASRMEHFRPDVALTHRRGYLFGDPLGLRSLPRSQWVAVAHRADLERLRSTTSPIYYATPPADLDQAGVQFVRAGLVHRALPPLHAPAASWRPPSNWPKSGELLPGGPERYDYVTRKIAVSYSDAAARALWEQGRREDALEWFADAAAVGFDNPGARLNYATAAATLGRPEVALQELLAARTLAPHDAEPAARIAVFLSVAGRHRDAARWFEKAYRIGPAPSRASDAARAWMLAGDEERAREWRERAG